MRAVEDELRAFGERCALQNGKWSQAEAAYIALPTFLAEEKETLKCLTMRGDPFITQLLSSWEDEENVYFVMVSTVLWAV